MSKEFLHEDGEDEVTKKIVKESEDILRAAIAGEELLRASISRELLRAAIAVGPCDCCDDHACRLARMTIRYFTPEVQ